MRILVSGSHGMIGAELVRQLEARGDAVIRLVRDTPGPNEVEWNLHNYKVVDADLEGFDTWVHLGGVGIGEKRLTERRKQAIWDSRVVSTTLLVSRMKELKNPPSTFVCASAVGFYGDQGEDELSEDNEQGLGYFAALCATWESVAQEASEFGVRVVNTRSGVVLDASGGSLKKQMPLFKLGIGGRLGNGFQWMSWISLLDEVRAIMHIIDTSSLSGPVNLTSPEPVRNGEYTAYLALALNRPAFIPSPRPLLVLALGASLTDELLLTSQRVIPQKLLSSGFIFELPSVQATLKETLHSETA